MTGPINPADNALKSTSSAAAVTLVTVEVPNGLRFLIVDNTASGTGDMLVSIDGGTAYPLLVRAGQQLNLPLPYAPQKDIVMKRAGATDVTNAWGCLMLYERP